MKKFLFMVLGVILCLTSCIKGDIPESQEQKASKEDIDANVMKVFGVTFASDHDWCTTVSGKVRVNVDKEGFGRIKTLRILTCSPFGAKDANGSAVLNEVSVKNGDVVDVVYDAPMTSTRLYAALVNEEGEYFVRGFVNGQESVSFNEDKTSAVTRGASGTDDGFLLASSFKSYGNERKWTGFSGEMLYRMSDADEISQCQYSDDYGTETKADIRDIIFTYLPNGRKFDNITKIKESDYYNENSYPITTGEKPIKVSPVYRNDGTSEEVSNSSLYYYYFKESDLAGKTEDEKVLYLKSLPKYMAVKISRSMWDNDVLKKQDTYTLIYWGDGTPVVGETVGTYNFPPGYKIGFMLRCEHPKNNKKGEVYGDGRLNDGINGYGDFRSSKMDPTDARMAWLGANGMNFLCIESGTDRDINDLIVEVEGGIVPIGIVPELPGNVYTFCFEDTELGDYDLNDLVIKALRVDETHVRYWLVACGAHDELFVRNIDGTNINGGTEVHALFGTTVKFINTVKGETLPYVYDVVSVPKTFSFLDRDTQPYLYDKTTNKTIRIAEKGQDPHGILIPYDFRHPLERVCVKDVYLLFNNWGQDKVTDTDWYLYPEPDKVF